MKKLLVLFALLFGLNVFADDGLATLKAGCTDPTRFGHQRPPVDLKVTCDDTRFVWKYSDDHDGTFANHREICTKVTTDKPRLNSPKVCLPCDKLPTGYKCGSWSEVCQKVTLTYSVTCEEIMAMETIGKFCLGKLDTEIAATDEKILEEKTTGKVRKVCSVQEFDNGKLISIDGNPVKLLVSPR